MNEWKGFLRCFWGDFVGVVEGSQDGDVLSKYLCCLMFLSLDLPAIVSATKPEPHLQFVGGTTECCKHGMDECTYLYKSVCPVASLGVPGYKHHEKILFAQQKMRTHSTCK